MEVCVEDNSAIEGRRLPEASERQSVEARKSCGKAQARMCMGSQKRQACSQELLFEPFPSPRHSHIAFPSGSRCLPEHRASTFLK